MCRTASQYIDSILATWTSCVAATDVGDDGIREDISPKSVSIAVVIVSRVNKGSLGADTEAVLLFLGSLVIL